MVNDVRYVLRLLRRNPGFTSVSVLTLAFAIGLTTAVFSVVNGVLFRPLPYADPDTLVTISPSIRQEQWTELQQRSQAFAGVALFNRGYAPLVLEGDRLTQFRQIVVSPNFLQVLGVSPVLGRPFMPEDGQAGAEPVVMLTFRAWQQDFGGRADIVGRTAPFQETPRRIIGVLPHDFLFPARLSRVLGETRALTPLMEGVHGPHTVVGRLAQGHGIEAALAETRAILHSNSTPARENTIPSVGSLSDALLQHTRTSLLLIFGASTSVLLIAFANISGLVVARSRERVREFATRSALGANRAQLVRLLIVETWLLATAGGALGLLLAAWSFDALLATVPMQLPRVDTLAIDGSSIAVACALSALATLTFGALAGWRAAHHSHRPPAQQYVRGRDRGRLAIVAAQVAVAVILLSLATLFANGYARLLRVDLGFEPDDVLTVDVRMHNSGYSLEAQRELFARALERLRALPGVRAAGATELLPVTRAKTGGAVRAADSPATSSPAERRVVSDGYFETIGTAIVEGRAFDERDTSGAASVVIINRTLANRLWPGRSPLGRQLVGTDEGWAQGDPRTRTVVGVVEDLRGFAVDTVPEPQFYVPHMQWPWVPSRMVVRAEGEPAALAHPLENTLRSLDSRLIVENVRPLSALVTTSIAQPRFHALLLGVFGGSGLLLATLGLAGVVGYGVTRRSREIAIRIALGAQRRDVLDAVLRPTMAAVLAGGAAGLIAAIYLAQVVRSFLYEVEPTDAPTYASALVLFLAAALLAAWAPARRALRVNPITALKTD